MSSSLPAALAHDDGPTSSSSSLPSSYGAGVVSAASAALSSTPAVHVAQLSSSTNSSARQADTEAAGNITSDAAAAGSGKDAIARIHEQLAEEKSATVTAAATRLERSGPGQVLSAEDFPTNSETLDQATSIEASSSRQNETLGTVLPVNSAPSRLPEDASSCASNEAHDGTTVVTRSEDANQSHSDLNEAGPSSPRSQRLEVPRAPRVSQLDAAELDDGLTGMLLGRVKSALAVFDPSTPSRWSAEMELLAKLLIWRLGVMGSTARQTPGLRLQGLRYHFDSPPSAPTPSVSPSSLFSRRFIRRLRFRNSPAAAMYLYPLLTLLPPYLLGRLHDSSLAREYPQAPRRSWKKWWSGVIERAMWLGKGIELGGFLWFLWDGLFPSFVSRVLGVRMIPSDPSGVVQRVVSYEFMNRQLVWHGFTEFLLVLLPLMRHHRPTLRRLYNRSWSRMQRFLKSLDSSRYPREYSTSSTEIETDHSASSKPSVSNGHRPHPISNGMANLQGRYRSLPTKYCAICYARIRPGVDHDLGLPELETNIVDIVNEEDESARGNDTETDLIDQLEDALIHIPASGDCAASCVYCFHCLAQKIAQRAAQVKEDLKIVDDAQGLEEDEKEELGRGWECLRCRGEVFTVNRL